MPRQLAKYDQEHEPNQISVHKPLLFATVKLDRNFPGTNEIDVLVSDLEQGQFTFAPSDRMSVLLDVDTAPGTPDKFETKLLEVGEGYVGFRIKRTDVKTGWGQQLTVRIVGEAR
jgi:hypothetical protein